MAVIREEEERHAHTDGGGGAAVHPQDHPFNTAIGLVPHITKANHKTLSVLRFSDGYEYG